MKTNVYILSGGVGTGKTTTLMSWVKHKHAAGILTPVVNIVRKGFSISENRWFDIEAHANEQRVSVGRYNFSAVAFQQMNTILLESLQKDYDWIVIDEVGPLELRGEGLHNSVKKIVSIAQCNVLLVVREPLVDSVISHFEIQPTIVRASQLDSL